MPEISNGASNCARSMPAVKSDKGEDPESAIPHTRRIPFSKKCVPSVATLTDWLSTRYACDHRSGQNIKDGCGQPAEDSSRRTSLARSRQTPLERFILNAFISHYPSTLVASCT